MHKYYLLSNSVHLNKELIESLNIDDNHTVIMFNHSYPLQFVNHKNKILFIRETDKILTGINNNLSHYKKVYIFMTSDKSLFEKDIQKLDLQKINYEIININEFIKDHHPEYPEKNLPTCGFLGYLYILKYYNDRNNHENEHKKNIALVGFTGHHSNGNIYNGTEHNYMYEQIYYKNNDVLIYCKKE